MDKKPSEIIEEFVNLILVSHDEVSNADALVKAENDRTLRQTHVLEDCADEDLFEFSKQWREALRERRIQCDRKALYDNIHKFAINEQNKPTLKRLKTLLEDQKKAEEYLAIPYNEREFKGVKSK